VNDELTKRVKKEVVACLRQYSRVYHGLNGRGSILSRGKGFFSSPQRPERLWDPHSLQSNGYRGALSLGVTRRDHEADDSPLTNAEVNNGKGKKRR
jgi:hypothetical protein